MSASEFERPHDRNALGRDQAPEASGVAPSNNRLISVRHVSGLLLACALSFGLREAARGQAPSFEWVSHASLPLCCEPVFPAVVDQISVDSRTNLYLTGAFAGMATFGNTVLNGNINNPLMFLTRYDRFGNALWARSAGTAGDARGKSFGLGVATDASGAVYVAGNFHYAVSAGTFSFSTNGGGSPFQAFAAKYTSAGSVAWAVKLETTGVNAETTIRGVAVDSEGNLHVIGVFSAGVGNFGGILLSASGTPAAFFHAKFSPTGTVLWANKFDNLSDDRRARLATDNHGNSYVLAACYGTTAIGDFVLTAVSGEFSSLVAKYGSAGDVVWAKTVSGANCCVSGSTLAADAVGQLYVSGNYSHPGDFGSTNLPGDGSFLAKFSTAGDLAWAAPIGTNFDATGTTVDLAGSSYLTGYFHTTARFGTTNLTSRGASDIFIAKYEEQGTLAWVKQAGFAVADFGIDVALDTGGNLYASGTHGGAGNFDGISLPGSGGPDLYLGKLPSVASVPPTIAVQPQNQTVTPGSTASFQVGANGTPPLHYQWQLFGTDLPAVTNATFTIGNAQPDVEGDYTVVVSNNAGAMTSQVARLTILVAPAIVAPPQSQTVIAGTNATFTVTAVGTAPLRYQWWFNNTNLSRGANATLVIPDAQPTEAGNYFVVITNTQGAVTSSMASLTVRYALTVITNGHGTVTRGPIFSSYPPNLSVTLTATPEAGNSFRNWSGDASGIVNPLTITMTTNKIITANFSPLAVMVFIQGIGTVAKVPEKSSYNLGEPVTLTATPGPWHEFTRWGDGVTTNPRLITVGASNDYTVIFSPTTDLETLTFQGVSRTAPVGTPAIFVDGEFVVTSSVTRTGSLTRVVSALVSLQTTFPNGTIFYTLDGQTPSFESAFYEAPFAVHHSVKLRATAYRADFTVAREADPIEILLLPAYTLSASTAGGGTVTMTPPGGTYLSSTAVNVTATPAPGWTFLQWLGDVGGANPTTTVLVTRNKCVEAVFGTALGTTAVGGGTVTVDPPAALYPYGTTVRVIPQPRPGNYFVLWGNAASGNASPLSVVVTNAHLTISSAFAALSAGQFALAITPNGRGQATITPRANRYSSGAGVMVGAQPDTGQQFLGWSGDASGTQNPLPLVMNQSKLITAEFTKRPTLVLRRCSEPSLEDGFQLLLLGEFGTRYQVEEWEGGVGWSPLGVVTNSFGVVQFNDAGATNAAWRLYRASAVP